MTDAELVKETLRGKTNCFGQLVLRHQRALLGFLFATCRNRHDAEDILQDAFINAFRYLHSYDSHWQFNTWLYTIARRGLGAHLKVSSNISAHAEPGQHQAAPEANQTTGLNKALWQLIRLRLDDEPFNALWFYYVDELSHTEIAHILQRSQGWVKVNLHRSRNILAQLPELRNYFEDPEETAQTRLI